MLDKLFKLKAHGTTARTETIAGITTFLTMAYIIFVNPNVLAKTGMDHGAVFVATCIAAAIGCFIMGFLANLPVALAPGMGLNAFFTYTVVLQLGHSWQTALACVFLSGVLFILISLFRIREWLINAIPNSLKKAIAAGIGGFLAFIALQSAGIIVDADGVLVKMGSIISFAPLMTALCLLLIIAFVHYRVPGSVMLAILIVSALGVLFHNQPLPPSLIATPPSLAPTFMQMDFRSALDPAMYSIIFAFFFVDLFDTAGTLIAVTERGGLARDGKIPNLKKAMLADSGATIVGATLGTSNTTSFIESASGVAAGGRTGLMAVVVGILFLLSTFLSPLAQMVPSYATAGAILYVSVLMMYTVGEIDWHDLTEAAPVAITFLTIPLTYSIADGITLGFISYAIIKLVCGRYRELNIGVLTLAAILLFRLIWVHG
ncbi:NCS2 family permease [Cardiobacterium valvarum]|uniref:Putative permease n=1 Tax=Cardiobacterium valvarum F0432 TaxID=797473 RepID=G9ZF95_9GAMM|nr:NCS2 family permease [Cardiobacterium valvarum]EHM54116.1 putative permease [Cardiobacterium valvarum F0432]